jgi:hypothetical protein
MALLSGGHHGFILACADALFRSSLVGLCVRLGRVRRSQSSFCYALVLRGQLFVRVGFILDVAPTKGRDCLVQVSRPLEIHTQTHSTLQAGKAGRAGESLKGVGSTKMLTY